MSTNKYPDRFNPSLGWQKVLFRPDMKSQAAELNEIQSIINYQYSEAFQYLLSNYKITQGLQITFCSFTSYGYLLKVNSGQIFIKLPTAGYFINIPDYYCEIAFGARVEVGIAINFDYLTDSEVRLRNPLTGGTLFGDLGAHRLIVDTQLVLNQDSFPIAIIQGRSLGEFPFIFYYTSEGYSLQYGKDFTANLISSYLATRLYEESGDFIGDGLDIGISSTTSFTVSPGTAYIGGNEVDSPYPFSYQLPLYASSVYSIYLTYYGGFIVENKSPRTINQALLLGIVQQANGVYFSSSTQQRAVINSEVELMQTQNAANQEALLSILLNNEVVDNNVNTKLLSGYITDNFTNLDNTDVNSFLFNAAIVPKYGMLRPGFTSDVVNFTNLTPTTNSNVSVVNKNGSPYYLSTSFTEQVVINQSGASSFISVNNVQLVASIQVNPPNGTPDTTTTSFNSIADLEPNNAYLLNQVTTNISSITSTLAVTTVTVTGVGFTSLEDNLAITFGSVQIQQFTINNGSNGSTNFTIKAAQDGTFSISFSVPPSLPLQDYIIQVSNSTTTAVCNFRSTASSLSNLTFTGNFGQTFTIDSPLVVSRVRLALRSVPSFSSQTINLALVTITTSSNSLPTSTILGQGILTLTNVNLSSDGSQFSDVIFDVPISITSAGQYAIVVSPLVSQQPLEFYYADSNVPSLNSVAINGVQPLLGGSLLLCNSGSWTPYLSQDLTFQLVQALPSVNQSSITYQVTNPLTPINFLNRSISTLTPANTQVNYTYQDNKGNWVPFCSSQAIQGNPTSVTLQMTLIGTTNLFPIVLLTQSSFTEYSNLTDSTWVSITETYQKGYRNVEVEFTYFEPTGTSITVSFSSNSGQTWETLTQGTPSLADGNVPLYTAQWTATNLDATTTLTDISGNSSLILRTAFTIKIEFTSKDASVIPYVMKLKSLVY